MTLSQTLFGVDTCIYNSTPAAARNSIAGGKYMLFDA